MPDVNSYGRSSDVKVIGQEDTKLPNPRTAAGLTLEHRNSVKARRPGDAQAGRALEHQLSLRERETECEKTDDPWLVQFSTADRANPLEWKSSYRWFLTFLNGILLLNTSFASSAPAGLAPQLEAEFDIGPELVTLTLAIFILGYVLGPIAFGPASERVGRKKVLVVASIVYCAWQAGCALSKNLASLLIFRFLGGVFASAPFAVSGAVISDLHGPNSRGTAMAVFAVTPFIGPSLGTTTAGFITVANVSWRVEFWICCAFSGICALTIILAVPETYSKYILQQRAIRLRQETQDDRWHSELEDSLTGQTRARMLYDILVSPFVILVYEPVVFLICLYISFMYGVLYLSFVSYPFIFIQNHGWNLGEEGLAILAFPIGGILCSLSVVVYFNPIYRKKARVAAPDLLAPEERLPVAMAGATAGIAGFFVVAWTSSGNITPAAPLIGTVFLGYWSTGIFLGLTNYLVDMYLFRAATVLAANTITRSLFGFIFPLFGRQMYEGMGVPWATTLLGAVATLMVPIPFLFRKYGATLRKRSRFSVRKA